MNRGFFPESDVRGRRPLPLIAQCGSCGLKDHCKSPQMTVHGRGKRGILVVTDFPDRRDDERGRPLTGPDGELLRASLLRNGVDLRSDCWVTQAVRCKPQRGLPTPKHVEHCRPNLAAAVRELKPSTVILLGGQAVQSYVGWSWKARVGDTARFVSRAIPDQKANAWVCPVWHPGFVREALGERDLVPKLMFDEDLAVACSFTGRPYETLPDYRGRVEIVYQPKQAAAVLDDMVSQGGRIAFDYETTGLKPDDPKLARILCCSVCHRGRRTVAYEWAGEAVGATRRLLASGLPKIAHNLKFEQRWSEALLGVRVRNWHWDTMTSAHALDNRAGGSGLKFLSYVMLGQDSYDEEVEPFRSAKPGEANRLGDAQAVNPHHKLLYCGLDSLLTYEIYKIQRRLFRGESW